MLDTRKLFLKYYGRKFNSRRFQLCYMYLNIFDFFKIGCYCTRPLRGIYRFHISSKKFMIISSHSDVPETSLFNSRITAFDVLSNQIF